MNKRLIATFVITVIGVSLSAAESPGPLQVLEGENWVISKVVRAAFLKQAEETVLKELDSPKLMLMSPVAAMVIEPGTGAVTLLLVMVSSVVSVSVTVPTVAMPPPASSVPALIEMLPEPAAVALSAFVVSLMPGNIVTASMPDTAMLVSVVVTMVKLSTEVVSCAADVRAAAG